MPTESTYCCWRCALGVTAFFIGRTFWIAIAWLLRSLCPTAWTASWSHIYIKRAEKSNSFSIAFHFHCQTFGDILPQIWSTSWYQGGFSHGLRRLVDEKSVASCPQSCCNFIFKTCYSQARCKLFQQVVVSLQMRSCNVKINAVKLTSFLKFIINLLQVGKNMQEVCNIFGFFGFLFTLTKLHNKPTLRAFSDPKAAVSRAYTTPQISFFHSTRHPVRARTAPRVTNDVSTVQPACLVRPNFRVSWGTLRRIRDHWTWSRSDTGEVTSPIVGERKCVV